MARRRTKSGRFAPKARRRTSARSYRVKRRRNPRPSTKGGRRVSARRAYMKTAAPRRRRRNPTPMWNTPAIKYSAVAGVGALIGVYIDTAKWSNPVTKEGKPMLGWFRGSVLGSAITFALAHYAVKGAANKNLVRAAAVGMLINPAIELVKVGIKKAENDTANGNNNNNASSQGYNSAMARLRAGNSTIRLSAATDAAQNFSKASRNLDNVAA